MGIRVVSIVEHCVDLGSEIVAALDARNFSEACRIMRERDALYLTFDATQAREFRALTTERFGDVRLSAECAS